MRFPAAGIGSRRRFARGMMTALIGGLAMAVPGVARVAPDPDLGALVGRRESAERVGRRYLAMLPAGTGRHQLLNANPTLDRALRKTHRRPEVAARLLRQGIDDDFRHADTVVVDGWVLSRTEACLCAIVALF